jgi:membrane protein implicated in regulation of membrane protease activity
MRGLGVFERGMLLVMAGILVAAVGAGRGVPSAPGAVVVWAAGVAGLTVLTLFVWAARLHRLQRPRAARVHPRN